MNRHPSSIATVPAPPPSAATTCARAGETDESVTRPSAPAIYQTTAFDIEGLEQLDAVYAGTQRGHIYTRFTNPNMDAFAEAVAELDGAEAGVASASGMGGLSAVLLTLLKPGDHLIAARTLYGQSAQLINRYAEQFGVAVDYVDASRPAEFAAARRDTTKLALVEVIANPTMQVTDLPAVVEALGGSGSGAVPLMVDATFSPPPLCRPISLGAALVWHSGSKYLNGHGDVMLGAVVGRKDIVTRLRSTVGLWGLNANPFECWLATRGMRTLPLRMARVSATAMELAGFLKSQRGVARVDYPGLPDHPTHAVASRMLSGGFGGMLSFELPGGRPAVGRFLAALKGIPFSPTLADARTTISYPAGTSHRAWTAAQRAASNIPDGLVRLSVGLEEPAELKAELTAALVAAG